MNRLLLSLAHSFYMVQAYLADAMQDPITAADMESIANDYYRRWCVESIQ